MAIWQELLELEAEKQRDELYRQTKKGPILQHPDQQDFLRNTPLILPREEVRKEFMPTGFKDSPELPSNDPLGRMRLPLPRPEPPDDIDTGTSDVGIASLIPRLNILGDKPEYNTDNPFMDKLLNLTNPKKNRGELLAAIFAGMADPNARTVGAAFGSGAAGGLEYKREQNARYYRAIGAAAGRRDKMNKTRYTTNIDWQLAQRQADIDIWEAQLKAKTAAAKAGFDEQAMREKLAIEELKQLDIRLNNPNFNWPDIETGQTKEQALKRRDELQERRIGETINMRSFPGGVYRTD